MNRADLLYEALKDGKPRSRREIFDRVGYMLTNNAASELRARGYDVRHFKDGRLDVYQLGSGLLDRRGMDAAGTAAPSPIEQSVDASPPPAAPSSAPVWLLHEPAAFAPAGGPADGIHGAGAESSAAGKQRDAGPAQSPERPAAEQLSIMDAIEAAA